MIKNKIRELEFKVALELFGAVARLVPKDEIAKNPKAKAALDKEWENLRTKGVWDESRVRECKSIVDEARKNGQTVHLGRIFEASYEKGSELPPDDPRRKFRDVLCFRGTMFVTNRSCFVCRARFQPRWKLQNSLMHSDRNLDSAKLKLTPFRHISRPSSLGCPRGIHFPETDGQNTGVKSFGNPWFLRF